jgi:hypothetical protein
MRCTRTTRARDVAAHVDQLLAEGWEVGPRLVALEPDNAIVLEPVDEPVEAAIAHLGRKCAAVACLSALGHVTADGCDGDHRQRARITIAVTCCEVATVIRLEDGTAQATGEASGALVAVLRSWARLDCSSCERPETVREWGIPAGDRGSSASSG